MRPNFDALDLEMYGEFQSLRVGCAVRANDYVPGNFPEKRPILAGFPAKSIEDIHLSRKHTTPTIVEVGPKTIDNSLRPLWSDKNDKTFSDLDFIL